MKKMANSNDLTFDFSNEALFVPVYIPLLDNTKRTKIIYGSRASAKSFFVCQKKIIKCLSSPRGKFKCLMVRKMKEDVRDSLFATLKKVIEMWNLQPYFRIYEGVPKIVCTLNGNSFLPKGLNQTGGKTGNAKSIENPTDCIIDEADEITLTEYIKLSGSLRGSSEIEEILVFNPPEEDHWIIQMFFPPKETFERPDGSHTYIKSIVPNAVILHTTHLNNPYLTDSEKEFFDTLERHNFDLYQTDGLGLLKATKTGGEALKKFDPSKHVFKQDLFNNERRVLCCWDFNRRPHHTVGIWQFWYDQTAGESGLFYADLVKEFTIPDTSVSDTTKHVNAWLKERDYRPKVIRLIGDHSGTKELDSGSETFIAQIERELKAGGFEVLNETSGNPRVISSLEFLNDIFGGLVFMHDQSNFPSVKIAIRINQNCTFHVADFSKTKTDKEGKLLKIEKKELIKDGSQSKTVSVQVRGHGVDEARYMAVGVFEEEYFSFRKKE